MFYLVTLSKEIEKNGEQNVKWTSKKPQYAQ